MSTPSLRSHNWFGKKDLDGFSHRSWIKAEGFSDLMFDGRPVIGIANSWSELTNCNAHLRQVAEAVKIPVVAAGGIADGRGWVAAFALGAEGVQMGTRFLATEECPIPAAYKQAILEAADNTTMIAARRGYPIRVLKNKAALAVRRMDESGASQDEINAYVDAMAKGAGDDWENKLMSAGQIAGGIRKVLTVGELIRSMVA